MSAESRELPAISEENIGFDSRADIKNILVPDKQRTLDDDQKGKLFSAIESRLRSKPKHYKRPKWIRFSSVKKALEENPGLMWSLAQMENTGGEPDIIDIIKDKFVFAGCSSVPTINRRSMIHADALEYLNSIGAQMMTEDQYSLFQSKGVFDYGGPSTWVMPNDDRRKAGYVTYAGRNSSGVYFFDCRADETDFNRGWRGILYVPKARKSGLLSRLKKRD